MSFPSLWFAVTHVLGWTLLNFLWQGALLGLVYAAVRPLTSRGTARYHLGMSMLLACAACPMLTLWKLLDAVSPPAATGEGGLFTVTASGGYPAGGASWALPGFDLVLPWLVLAWSFGVLLLSVRTWREWRKLKALVRMAEMAPTWQRAALDLARRFGLRRRVDVLCSHLVSTPVLIGWIRPVILLPLAVATGFPASQVELILAHELAHLRRWDPLANLFQIVVETVHFYHPVVRWISRDVRNEREICCDRLALSLGGGSQREFVTVLAELGDLREHRDRLLLAATGGVLLDRAQQLMALPGNRAAQGRSSGQLVATLLGVLLVAVTLQLHWTQAHVGRSVSASMRQWQGLVTGMKLPLAPSETGLHIADLAPMTVGTIHSLAMPVAKPAPATMSEPAMVSLPHPSSWPVTDLRPAQPAPLVLNMDRAVLSSPASASTPVPVRMRQPVYPQAALRRGIEGQVVLEFSLAPDGGVRDLQLVSAAPAGIFDQAAIDAMRGWQYAVPDAAAGSRRYRQTIAFTLGAARSGASPGRSIHARADCRMVTGTHICRWPDGAG